MVAILGVTLLKKKEFPSSSSYQLIDFYLGVPLCLHFPLNFFICFICVCVSRLCSTHGGKKGHLATLKLQSRGIVRLSVSSGTWTLLSARSISTFNLWAISPTRNCLFVCLFKRKHYWGYLLGTLSFNIFLKFIVCESHTCMHCVSIKHPQALSASTFLTPLHFLTPLALSQLRAYLSVSPWV